MSGHSPAPQAIVLELRVASPAVLMPREKGRLRQTPYCLVLMGYTGPPGKSCLPGGLPDSFYFDVQCDSEHFYVFFGEHMGVFLLDEHLRVDLLGHGV